MRYYIIAGERSGDLHGSNLVKAIKRLDPSAVFRGFGGDYMKKEGVELVVHYEQMAFMGFIALITNYTVIKKMLKLCKTDIIKFKPDVVIHIDYGGFNRRIAKFAKSVGIKTFYYIPPKIWAWYQSRAKEIKANVDRMFVILPFEKEFYKKYDWEVDYVGNPVLDAVKEFQPDPDFLTKNGLTSLRPIIALLPGSRRMELANIVPVMAEVAGQYPDFQFVVASVEGLDDLLYQPLKNLKNVEFISNDTYNLLHISDAAIVTSGTATLETALFRVPQVCVYRTSWLEYRLVKMIIKVPFISLVNLIADKEVIHELIQNDASLDAISNELKSLVKDDSYRKRIFDSYDDLYRKLDTGSASENTAKLIIKYLRNE